ncbi:hypothetical protein AB835_14970 [Candidatus Endobugula sertula]|uniref:Transcription factor zinc-finger domain-containing protein n=1 Tax=Candidatus Endobugula sertula TaxID=62101 RepID=A0A1D2QL47_9GAMM|nr:hypothetical protein AB835_14970 [Candidatus Endobugula sertula]
MKCTKCKEGQFIPGFIDSLFRAHICNNCGGNWVLIEDFVTWKEKNPEYQFANDLQVEEEPTESPQALLCPVTGALLLKFKISSATNHRIDYSAAVGGIWLDKGEWALLKTSGVAGSLNHIVTQSWQHQLRTETAKENFQKLYTSKFGKETYAKVKEVRDWLQSQPQKADLRAYILAEDPYSTEK